MRAGIRREHVGSSTHTVHTHTHTVVIQTKKRNIHTNKKGMEMQRGKSKQIAHPILISLAAMQVERAPVCLCIAEFELKPEERERVKDNKKTTTKRLAICLFI
jgi:hypothetical protein